MNVELVGYVGYVMHRSPNGPVPQALQVAQAFFDQPNDHYAMLDNDFEMHLPLALAVKGNAHGWTVPSLEKKMAGGAYFAPNSTGFSIEVPA
jgi:hypothetical protein